MQPSRPPLASGSPSTGSATRTESEPRPGQRDRQKAATRDALRAAAMRLFAERGFRDTTVDDIAAAVGVSRRTFFLHFNSKDEVLLGHITSQLDLFIRELAAAPADLDPAARAWHAVAGLADSMQQRGDLLLQLDLLQQAPELLAVNLQKMTGFEGAITAAVQRWRTPTAASTDPVSTDPASTDPASTNPASTDPASTDPVDDDGYALLVGATTIAALRTALTMWMRQDGRGPISALFLNQVQRLRDGLT